MHAQSVGSASSPRSPKQGWSPEDSKETKAPEQESDAIRVVSLVTLELGRIDPIANDQAIVWWEQQWTKRWTAEFERSAKIREEEAQTNEARRIRKACKEAKLHKDETAKRVEEAKAQLSFVVPPCPSPMFPEVLENFTKEQVALHAQRTKEAKQRIDAIVKSMQLDDTSDNEVEVSKATLADAKLKVMGKKPHFVSELKLPVKDFRKLKQGTGVRKGVSCRMGDLLEEYRQQGKYEGSLVVRQKEVDDEWAAQIGKAIASGIGKLLSLDLACNKFEHLGMRDLSLGIAASSTLTSLNLGNNRIDRVGLDYLADSLLVNTTITELSLNSVKFGAYLKNFPKPQKHDLPHEEEEENANEVEKEAERKKEEEAAERKKREETAKAAKIKRNLYGEKPPPTPPPPPEPVYEVGLGRMIEALIVTKTLRTLDLSGNRMGPVLFGQLCESLSLNQTLRWFGVAGNCLGPDGGAHLGRLLSAAPRIQYIDASSNFFGSEGADYMSLQIDTNTALTDLRLSSNKMAVESSPWLGQILKFCPNLIHLDVAGNDVDEGSSQSLREALETGFTNLTTLKMSQNPIGDNGMLQIAMGLGGLVMLRSLQLFSCEITDAGAAAIGAAAATLPCLRKLELAFNRISHAGFRLMTEWLLVENSQYRLTDLNMNGNVCGDDVTDSIARLLQRGPFLQRLSFRGNFLTMQGVQRMIELVHEHENLVQVELLGNLDHDDDGARRELNYLANLLEERLHFMRGEEATSTIEPLSSSLFSAHKEQMTPGMTSPATPMFKARGLVMSNHISGRQLPIAAQIRLAQSAAYSSPLRGYSPPPGLSPHSPEKHHWKAGGPINIS